MTYTSEQLRERLDEILRQVRSGEKVLISEEGKDVAEIRALRVIKEPVSVEETLCQLEQDGVISSAAGSRPSLEEIVRELEEEWSVHPPKPGGLARFLETRG
jgi:antitoxin (DNA-binding transcriptional repressor) of toxin-antitoxin stability system